MAESIAVVSVISSAVVAIGGLVVSYLSGREQRRHEERLAYEERVWEVKSEGLFTVIAVCRSLLDACAASDRALSDTSNGALPSEGSLLPLGALESALERLEPVVPVVEAYASVECRSALAEFRNACTGYASVNTRYAERLCNALIEEARASVRREA